MLLVWTFAKSHQHTRSIRERERERREKREERLTIDLQETYKRLTKDYKSTSRVLFVLLRVSLKRLLRDS